MVEQSGDPTGFSDYLRPQATCDQRWRLPYPFPTGLDSWQMIGRRRRSGCVPSRVVNAGTHRRRLLLMAITWPSCGGFAKKFIQFRHHAGWCKTSSFFSPSFQTCPRMHCAHRMQILCVMRNLTKTVIVLLHTIARLLGADHQAPLQRRLVHALRTGPVQARRRSQTWSVSGRHQQ